MAEHFLYLTTTGRTSGLPRTIEIWFVERAGNYYMVSQGRERSNWVRNLAAQPRATFSIGTGDRRELGRATTEARGRAVSAIDEPELQEAVCALMDAKYGWSDGLVVELCPSGPSSQ